MAAGLPQSHCGLFHHLLFSLWALQGGLRTSVSGVKVTQHPPLANKPEGETVKLSCNVDVDNYQFYWYQQRPGHTNLKQLGVIKPFTSGEGDTLEEKPGGEINSRLSGKRDGRTANLILEGLQLNDTGLYLCASKDTVTVAAPGAVTKLTTKQQYVSQHAAEKHILSVYEGMPLRHVVSWGPTVQLCPNCLCLFLTPREPTGAVQRP
ncbi:V-set and immunoglobulin domain-containing protein 2-like [Podarcis lilfordi]|nr:V-set and immunoglobulin domain-containing protein 2-like [Podarcis lilfordi]